MENAGAFRRGRFSANRSPARLAVPEKNLRTIRSLDFFDRYGFSTSLHPPPAALGSESPSPATR